MLTYPDRRRYEQIRAKWETALAGEEESVEMVGKKVRHTATQPPDGEPNGGSKFRRKLSSLISNPLLQRKVTPRTQDGADALSVGEPEPMNANKSTFVEDSLLSPKPNMSISTSKASTVSEQAPLLPIASDAAADSTTTLQPLLPRSRTFSFIPRPTRTISETLSNGSDNTTHVGTSATMRSVNKNVGPSKIPALSPPHSPLLAEHPRLNSQRHLQPDTLDRATNTKSTGAFTATETGSPRRVATRSRTTPNLARGTASSQPMKQARSKAYAPSRPVNRPMMQENVPINVPNMPVLIRSSRAQAPFSSYAQASRQSYLQAFRSPQPQVRTPTFTQVNTSPSNQVRTTPHAQARTSPCLPTVNPPNGQATKSHRAQQRPIKQESLAVAGAMHKKPSRQQQGPSPTIKQPTSPTTPTAQRQSREDKVRQTPVTAKRDQPLEHPSPYRFSSRQAGKTNSGDLQPVRGMTKDSATHLSPIPDTTPLRSPRSPSQQVTRRRTLGTPNPLGGMWPTSRALAANDHQVRITLSPRYPQGSERHGDCIPSVPPIPEKHRQPVKPARYRTPSKPLPRSFSAPVSSKHRKKVRFEDKVSRTGSSTKLPTPIIRPSTPKLPSQDPVHYDFLNLADMTPMEQVKDYMPTEFWAGRFQSRIDHWRTHAMNVELEVKSRKPTDSLGQCNMDQEDLAACRILGQLRNLCISEQATTSFREFESKYRKDHGLPDKVFDPREPPARKQDENSGPKGSGAFGRAVRKLTPRKTSLVNLIKGKGWNKPEDGKNDSISGDDPVPHSSDS